MNNFINKAKIFLGQPVVVNILTVGVITVIVKILSFYKEIIIAATFGLSELLDTFLIALLVPGFIYNVFIGALSNIFIPNYISLLKGNRVISVKEKGEFQSIIYIITFAICFIFLILTIIFESVFLSNVFPGHSEQYYSLISKQLYYLLPCLFFWGYSSILGGLLEVEGKFFFTSIAGVIAPITTIICLLFYKEQLGNLVLAVGILIGSVLGFIYVLLLSIFVYKTVHISIPKLNINSLEMIRQLPPKISSGLLAGSNDFVDQFFAASLIVGSITALNYGIKIPAFITSILLLALGKVLLPHFSKLIYTDIQKAYKQLFLILKTIFIASTVVVLIAIFYSDEIIKLLFERDQFSSNDTIIVSNIQKIALIYIPFHLCTLILVRFLTSINKNKFMAWLSFLSLVLNIILNTILIKRYEVYGLITATTIIYIVSSLLYMRFTIKEYDKIKLG